jgi:hypothetical protein
MITWPPRVEIEISLPLELMSTAVIGSDPSWAISEGVFFMKTFQTLAVLSQEPDVRYESMPEWNQMLEIGPVCPVNTSSKSPVLIDHM